MSGDSTPVPRHGSQGHTSPPQDFESSPLYQALNARLSRQESALSSLSAQVDQLSALVKSSLAVNNTTSPSRPKSTKPNPVSVFAPFDSELPLPGGGAGGVGAGVSAGLPKSPFIPTSTPQATSTPGPSASSGNQDATISALTHQITALSTSVAQLQRLQQSQAQLTRQSSNPPPTLASLGGERHPGPLALGPRPLHQGVESLINSSGPMTTPNASSSHLAAPSGTQGSHSPFGPGPGAVGGAGGGGGGRPGINRSFSSGVIGGAPGPGGLSGTSDNTGFLPHRQHGHAHTPSALARDWPSPGPGQAGNDRSGALTPGGSGVTAPGAGIVITKWEHLNLKVDLLRSISKYGIGPPNKIQTRVLPFMIKGNDIIAQAPPTTERIISYVIPALALCQTLPPPSGPYGGPAVIIVTTTVDQAMQCHKLVRGVGGPIGIRSGIAAGAAGSSGLQNEIANMQRDAIHILIGTPAKIAEVMTSRNGLGGGECRLLILDEVDQLIARNLYENVLNVAKLLPAPRRGNSNGGTLTPGGALAPFSPGLTSPYDAGRDSPFNPASKTPFPTSAPGSRFGGASTPVGNGSSAIATAQTGQIAGSGAIERQTCLFSNTIPTDVINFSQSLQVRDPVRVLVRREGGPNSQESVSSITPGINLKHTYVYLTITGSAQSGNAPAQSNETGPGTIGSGRTTGQASEEQTRAKEYKLDMLVKMLDDYPLWQAVIHVGTYSMLEAVVFKLQGRKWETLYLTPDMPPTQKKAILQQWRVSLSGNGPRFLVVFDVSIKPPEVPWAPLVINFDLPRSVEGYAHRAAAAVPPTTRQGPQVNGVIVSFVQAAGGDVEMLRSTECAYRFKSAEIPTVFHDLFNH
ncbi:translation initiation factor [Kwoniella heveanensis BCC8398]|uniref:RNA helicase n=1 Tax=Kwoniella heveanensis BCC8398 TaxID=1296120 RepID=A0A1B9GZE1_9TREE|nr:translation initiation factor [Kwoniella heveanensis BCC8398]